MLRRSSLSLDSLWRGSQKMLTSIDDHKHILMLELKGGTRLLFLSLTEGNHCLQKLSIILTVLWITHPNIYAFHPNIYAFSSKYIYKHPITSWLWMDDISTNHTGFVCPSTWNEKNYKPWTLTQHDVEWTQIWKFNFIVHNIHNWLYQCNTFKREWMSRRWWR